MQRSDFASTTEDPQKDRTHSLTFDNEGKPVPPPGIVFGGNVTIGKDAVIETRHISYNVEIEGDPAVIAEAKRMGLI